MTLQWRNNECEGVSNHPPHDAFILWRHHEKNIYVGQCMYIQYIPWNMFPGFHCCGFRCCFWWIHVMYLPIMLRVNSLVPGGRFKKAYELLNLWALKFSPLNKIHIFQCMGKIFCVEFQRYPLKFHTKYLTHTLKGTIFIQHWNFKSS